jgi:hypothetical protein
VVIRFECQPVTLDVKVDESLLILDRLYGVNLRIANAGLDLPVNR